MVRDDDRERDDDPESGQVGRRGAALLHDKPVYDRRQYAANGRLNRQELFSNDQGLIYNGTGRVKVRGDASLIKKEEMREVRVRAVDPVAGSERGGGFVTPSMKYSSKYRNSPCPISGVFLAHPSHLGPEVQAGAEDPIVPPT